MMDAHGYIQRFNVNTHIGMYAWKAAKEPEAAVRSKGDVVVKGRARHILYEVNILYLVCFISLF